VDFLPNAPTYVILAYPGSVSGTGWALLAGPIMGLVSVLYVRLVAWADSHRPKGRHRLWAPVAALGVLGGVSIPLLQLLGNGNDEAELAFTGQISPLLLVSLILLRPAATLLCLGSGAAGGLFTPSLTMGAMLGGVLGLPWSWLSPGVPPDCSRWWAPARCSRPQRRTDFGHCADHGADRIRPHGDRSTAARGGDRDAGRAHHRATIHLRRARERPAGPRTAACARSRTE
jgi:hypothetical protein